MFKKNDLVEFKDKTHTGKYSHDSIYVILSVNSRMKDISGDREWHDSVLYYKLNESDIIFAREYNDFITKFKKISNEEK